MSLLMKWVIGAAVALSALFAVLTQLVLPQAVKQIIPSLEKTAAEYVNGSVTVGDALWPGSNVIVLKDVKLKNREAQTIAELPETRPAPSSYRSGQSSNRYRAGKTGGVSAGK